MNTQLRRIREHLGMNQAQAAAALGISQGAWSKYERGALNFPLTAARSLIKVALGRRLLIDLNHIYEEIPLPNIPAASAPAAPTVYPELRRRGA